MIPLEQALEKLRKEQAPEFVPVPLHLPLPAPEPEPPPARTPEEKGSGR